MRNCIARAMTALAMIAGSGLPGAAAAETAPPPPGLEFAFEEVVTLAEAIRPGETAIGGRNIIPITGGTFSGPGIKGTILPGGWDWQLFRKDGCLSIEADYMIRTDDGVVINVLNKGVACRTPDGRNLPTFTQPVFEAPIGKYDWLSKSAFVGTLEPTKADGKFAVKVRFYRVKAQ